jgi:site-specific recombinase XerD
MAFEPHLPVPGHPQDRSTAGQAAAAGLAEERKTMAGSERQRRLTGPLDAGPLGADIASFRLHLAAEGKSARTVQGYTSAVRWFAAAWLLGQAGKTSWKQADARDIQQWMVHLLDRYSSAYGSIQFRALRQFFKWPADEEQCPDPMTRLRAPKVTVPAVPVFTSVELSELQKACQGRSFAARRDAAIIAVLTATGIRLSELAGICCHPDDPARSDLDLQAREIRIRGKGRTARTVKISHQAARSLDRYLRARARHPQAWRPQLWLGVNSRGPLTAAGIYQAVARSGRQAGVTVYPHRFRHHFSHTWLDRGGAERDLMELNGWDIPPDAHPVRRQRPRRPRPPQLRPHHGRHHLTRRARRHPAARLDHTAETMPGEAGRASKGAAGYPAPALGQDHGGHHAGSATPQC